MIQFIQLSPLCFYCLSVLENIYSLQQMEGKGENIYNIFFKGLLPVGRGFPLKNHSIFIVGSGYGSILHSRWLLCPSTSLLGPDSGVTKTGADVTRTSSKACLWWRLVSSRYWIFCRPSGCWVSSSRELLPVSENMLRF